MKKGTYTPENVGGACMTGRIMSNSEIEEVSSYIAQFKAKKKTRLTTEKSKSKRKATSSKKLSA